MENSYIILMDNNYIIDERSIVIQPDTWIFIL